MGDTVVLHHGSKTVVTKPTFGIGNVKNDYGLGFYCTEDKNLACEWACPTMENGVCNTYELDMSGLKVIDLREPDYSTLNWLALLVQNRSFESTHALMRRAKAWLLSKHLPDTRDADIIVGMRADDSYYSFARSFLDGRLCLRELEQALQLGGLGHQVVLKSKRAFDQITFLSSELVPSDVWHGRRQMRDRSAREAYRTLVESSPFDENATYITDFMRRDVSWDS